MKLLPSIIILFLFIYLRINAQEAVSVSYNYGNILPHNTEIKPLIKGPVHGFTLNYYFPNQSGKEWRNFFNLPNYGLSYNFKSYGYPEVVGNSHSFTAFIKMSILPKRRYFDIGVIAFSGLGYFTKIYDPVENPTNKAISSHLNISGDLRLYTKIRFHPVFLEYSLGLNHFSNGLIKAPNLGLNVRNRSFTLGYEFEDQAIHETVPKSERNLYPRSEFWIYGATGIKEVEGMYHKKYIPVNASLNYSYRTSVINKMGIGFDFVYDPSLEDFAYINYNYKRDPPLNFRSGISLHNEFVFGKTGIFTSYGFNFRMNEYYTQQRYYKVGFKFYFKNVIGVALLRAIPLFRADLVEIGVGYRIAPKSKKHE